MWCGACFEDACSSVLKVCSVWVVLKVRVVRVMSWCVVWEVRCVGMVCGVVCALLSVCRFETPPCESLKTSPVCTDNMSLCF